MRFLKVTKQKEKESISTITNIIKKKEVYQNEKRVAFTFETKFPITTETIEKLSENKRKIIQNKYLNM
jgi:hypothetical protein